MSDQRFTDPSRLLSVDFEVDGLVQGVQFRPYAFTAAQERGLRGWVKNTRRAAIYGVIQGHKAKYAFTAAQERGLRGWVKNTRRGAIYGVIQGDKTKVIDMKMWLVDAGPPRSIIQGCLFTNERELVHAEYPGFTIEPNDW